MEVNIPRTVRIVELEVAPFNNAESAKVWACAHGIPGLMSNVDSSDKGEIAISLRSIEKMLSGSAVRKSVTPGIHFAALMRVRDIIRESFVAEIHPDFKKINGVRSVANGVNPMLQIAVLYGAVSMAGIVYRAKTTLKLYRDTSMPTKAYSYEISNIEVLTGTARVVTLPNVLTSMDVGILLQTVCDVNGRPLLPEGISQSQSTNTNNKTKQTMKKLIAMLGAVVAAVTSAWAAVGDPVSWSNLESAEPFAFQFTKNSGTCSLTLTELEGCPANATVAISTIAFPTNNKTFPDTITINGATATKAIATWTTKTFGNYTLNQLVTYTFSTPASVRVGASYPITSSGDLPMTGIHDLSAINLPGLTGAQWTDYTTMCSVSGTVSAMPTRDAAHCVWDGTSWTPAIPEDLNDGDSITVRGAGAVINFANPCSLTVEQGGELTINGPTGDEVDPLAITATNAGTIKTTGKVALGGTSTGTVQVLSGTLTSMHGYQSKALAGTITIDNGATLVVTQTDSLNYDGSVRVNVSGTLDLGTKRWSIGSNNKVFVYGTGVVTGEGDGQGALDFFSANRLVLIGNATIDATIRARNNGQTLQLAQSRNSTVTFSGKIIGGGNVEKTYATPAEGNQAGKNDAGNAFIKFSGANTFTGSFAHKTSCGTLVLMPGVAFSDSTAITVESGTGFDIGANSAEGKDATKPITIGGAVTYSSTNNLNIWAQVAFNGGITLSNTNTKAVIQGGAKMTIPASSTVKVDASSTGKIGGAGKVVSTGNPQLTADTDWTGTVEIPALNNTNSTQVKLQQLGQTGSTIILKGITGNTWISAGGTTAATLQLDGAVTINNGSSYQTYTIGGLTGEGNLTLSAWADARKSDVKFVFKEVKGYTGTLSSNFNTTTIEKVVLDEAPTTKIKLISLAEGSKGTVSAVYVGEEALDLTTDYTMTAEEGGIYLAPNSGVTIAIPSITGLTATVTVDGETVDATSGSIVAMDGATVVVTYTPSEINYVGGGTVTLTVEEGAMVDTESVTPATLREAGAIYATSGTCTAFALSDGTVVSPITGDSIVLDSDHITGNAVWGLNITSVAAYPVTLSFDEANLKGGIPENANLTITKGRIYLYDNVGAGATVTGEGAMDITRNSSGAATNGSIGNRAEIECAMTVLAGSVITINGDVSATGTITCNGSFKLADGATLTCEELPAGKVTTDDATKVVVYEDGAYQLVDKPTVSVASTTISGLTSAYVYTAGTLVEYFSDWEANFEVTFGANIAAGDVELKGSYGEYDMQTFPMPTEGVSANTPWTLLPSSGAGSVTYAEVVGIETFTCGVNNIKAAEGTTMMVELVLKKGDQRLVLNTQNYELGEPKATDLPGASELPQGFSKSDYNEWAAANGITAGTTAADATVAATAFVMGVEVGADQTIAQAAALKADEMLKEIATTEGVDLAALLAQAQAAGADGLEVEGYDGLTVKLVPTTLGEEVQTSAKLFKLSITIKK